MTLSLLVAATPLSLSPTMLRMVPLPVTGEDDFL